MKQNIKLRKRRKTKSNKYILVIILVSCFLICGLAVGYAVLRADLGIFANANIVNGKSSLGFTCTASSQILGKDTCYQHSCELVNNTKNVINGWYVNIDVPEDAHAFIPWGANSKLVDGWIKSTNKSYNGTLKPGASTTLGFIFCSREAHYILNDYEANPVTKAYSIPDDTENIEATFSVTALETKTDYRKFKITVNNKGKNINNWVLSFNPVRGTVLNSEMFSFITTDKETRLIGKGNNTTILSGTTLEVILEVQTNDLDYVPSGLVLRDNV